MNGLYGWLGRVKGFYCVVCLVKLGVGLGGVDKSNWFVDEL